MAAEQQVKIRITSFSYFPNLRTRQRFLKYRNKGFGELANLLVNVNLFLFLRFLKKYRHLKMGGPLPLGRKLERRESLYKQRGLLTNKKKKDAKR